MAHFESKFSASHSPYASYGSFAMLKFISKLHSYTKPLKTLGVFSMHILNTNSPTSIHGMFNTVHLLFSNFYPTCTIEKSSYALNLVCGMHSYTKSLKIAGVY